MSGHIQWNGRDVTFIEGETLAQALNRAGITGFGTGHSGQPHSLFCGIGQCQNCVVIIEGTGPREACLTLCRDGINAKPVGSKDD